ncbi:hypothetical protein [Levilactobacillus spicheri]|uniref:Uncharacterized protein n=1 Tax=Levilactobacillus spicheri TaxID=216463 RepID=A0ABQ0WQI4_9LACO|nr:hypothetical protein [Levilactobacillus spicheri]GEO67321.1 hypothetical protein LSP04_17400 [Levilactobacillus spicheri]
MGSQRVNLSDGTFISIFDSKYFHVLINDEELNGLSSDVAVRVVDSGSNYVDKLVQIMVPLGTPSDELLKSVVRQEKPIHLVIKDDNTGNLYESHSGYIKYGPNIVYGKGFPMGQFTVACVFMD